MNKTNLRKYILPTAFFGLLFLISAATVFLPKRDYSVNEKRYLAEFPKFSAHSVSDGEFQDGLENYLCDHIVGRDFFVGLNAYFSLAMGRNAASDIYKCKDGYLINAPKETDTQIFEKNLTRFEKFTENTGVPSMLMLVPTAGYIMESKLPEFHAPYRDAELVSLASELTPSIAFADARNTLFEGTANGRQMYYRTDHHLTSCGSYALYSLFCGISGLTCPPAESYSVKTYGGFCGTTKSSSGYWLTPDDDVELWSIGDNVSVTVDDGGKVKKSESLFFTQHLKDKDKYPVFLDGNHALVKIENPSAPENSILIIKDSFAQCFAPFLSHNFKEVYMIDLRYYRKSVSDFVDENNIEEILYMYGIDSLLTDTNSAWLR